MGRAKKVLDYCGTVQFWHWVFMMGFEIPGRGFKQVGGIVRTRTCGECRNMRILSLCLIHISYDVERLAWS